MLFNGIDLSPYFRIKDIRGRGLINRKINAISIPGMDGEHVESVDTPSKVLEVDIRIISDDLRKTIDELNAILATDEPVPIVFPDEPDMTYYGMVETSEESGERVHLGWHDATIYIRRSDPYKYGPKKEFEFQDSGIVENEGTAEADPIFELEVLQPTTFAMVSNGEEYNMIGRPIQEGDIPTKPFERVLVDELGTLVGWSALPGGSELPHGIVGGSMKTTGDTFEAESFGSNPNGWVGPAVRKSFSEPIQDFAIDIAVTSRNTLGQTGRLQALLLDASDNVVATMSLIDGTIDVPRNSAVFTFGGRTIMNEYGDNHGAYNNETMHLNLSRNGKTITAYAYKQTGNIRTGRVRRVFFDNQLELQTPIAQIVLYISKYKTYQPFPMSFNKLVVDKLYQPSDLEIPYIADIGDIITFDHQENLLLINGEPKKDLKDFGGTYFKLAKGENALVVMPENSFNTKLTYRERYR